MLVTFLFFKDSTLDYELQIKVKRFLLKKLKEKLCVLECVKGKIILHLTFSKLLSQKIHFQNCSLKITHFNITIFYRTYFQNCCLKNIFSEVFFKNILSFSKFHSQKKTFSKFRFKKKIFKIFFQNCFLKKILPWNFFLKIHILKSAPHKITFQNYKLKKEFSKFFLKNTFSKVLS